MLTHLQKKTLLQSYTKIEEHNPKIIEKISFFIIKGGASFRKRYSNGDTLISFSMSGKRFEEAKKIHNLLSANGYCNPEKVLEIKTYKNTSETYVRFTTYTFKSFNPFRALFYNTEANGHKNKTSEHRRLQKLSTLKEHEPEVIDLFVGCLLGDASTKRAKILTNNQNKLKNTVIGFGQGEKNILYLQHIKDFLSERNYTNKNALKIKERFDERTNKSYSHAAFHTYAFKSLNELHNLFYRAATEEEGLQGRFFIKKIPENIAEFLTPRALAYWFMDDGSFHIYNGSAVITTHRYLKSEVELLCSALLKNFNLKSKPQLASKSASPFSPEKKLQDQYLIYFPKTEVKKLRSLILSYMLPSMYYKLGLDVEGNSIPLKSQTKK